jgi:hypothetical protein
VGFFGAPSNTPPLWRIQGGVGPIREWRCRVAGSEARRFMPDMVTIANFVEPLEAEMAKLRLESAGIEVFLSGENARILEPGLGPLQLQVSTEDEADAREILADPGAPAEEESGQMS